MSFVVTFLYDYEYAHSLTGYVGKDGELYWSANDAARLLRPDQLKTIDSWRLLHLADVKGDADVPRLPRHYLLSHPDALRLLQDERTVSSSVRAFALRLDHGDALVTCLEDNRPADDYFRPARIVMTDEEDLPLTLDAEPFKLWCELFKIEALHTFFGPRPASPPPPQPPPPFPLDAPLLDLLLPPQQTVPLLDLPPYPEQTFFPPEKVALYYQGRFYSYTLEM